MLEVKGERTPEIVGRFRAMVGEHRCTRVDSSEDFEAPGVWDDFLGIALDVKARYGLYGERAGDWDFPELGRTQYLGATKSTVRFRLYEKGKQPEYRHLGREHWVRAEVQVRPAREAKSVYSTVDPVQVWGASPFTRELAARLLQADVGRLAAGTVYRESKRDRALRWMCRQYGPHLISLRDDLGDWACVGKTLGEILHEQQQQRRRRT
jgi:DNA relaxase NicK